MPLAQDNASAGTFACYCAARGLEGFLRSLLLCLIPGLSATLQGDGKDCSSSTEEGGPYWSLMFEVSESYCKPVNQKTIKIGGQEWPEIVKETIQGAINTKLTSAEDQIVSIYHRSVHLLLAVTDAAHVRWVYLRIRKVMVYSVFTVVL